MNILIIGYSQSGKTSAAEYTADLLDGKVANTSDYIISDYAESNGVDLQWVKDNKGQIRDKLFDFARQKQAVDPTYPTSLAIDKGANIITGVRNPDELKAVRSLFDLVLWVSRPGYDRHETDKLSLQDADCCIVAENLSSLRSSVESLLS